MDDLQDKAKAGGQAGEGETSVGICPSRRRGTVDQELELQEE
jgi:hypothetical protein